MAVRFAVVWTWHRKKNKSYTISDFANYYDEANGYYWTGPITSLAAMPFSGKPE